jgi:hypothetical protein
MAYSKVKLKSSGDKASPCFRPFWLGKLSVKCYFCSPGEGKLTAQDRASGFNSRQQQTLFLNLLSGPFGFQTSGDKGLAEYAPTARDLCAVTVHWP